MRMTRCAPIALAIAALGAPPARALSFDTVPTFDEMVAAAPLVVRGRVQAIGDGQAAVPGGPSIPYTNITLRVDQAFAGASAGATLTLRQLGGRMAGQANRVMLIPGLADFSVGEDVYVIADDRKQPFFATLYGDYGLYRVATDGAGVQHVLSNQWQLMRTNGRPWKAAPQRFCNPQPDDRRRCTLVSEKAYDSTDLADTTPPPGAEADLTPSAFEARLRSLLASKPALPGQTVSGNAAQFESALAALRQRGLQLGLTRAQGSSR